jgi:hypothetical protein
MIFFFFGISDGIVIIRDILQIPKVLERYFLEEEMNSYYPGNERKKKKNSTIGKNTI